MSIVQDPVAQGVRSFESADFRRAMGQFASGVVVVTTETEGEVHGMTANAFMSGSLEPPLVIVSVACKARLHEKINASGVFGVSILAQEQRWASNHFAGKPSPDLQPQFVALGGVHVLDGSKVAIATQVCHSYPCGDHTLFVGEVMDIRFPDESADPLLYHCGQYGKFGHEN